MIQRVAVGWTNKAIADDLYLSEDTVKTHLRRAFAKTGARDRAHLVAWGYEAGLLVLTAA